jgi:hypothetical protein
MKIADEALKKDLKLIVSEDLSIFAKISKIKKLVKFLDKSGKINKKLNKALKLKTFLKNKWTAKLEKHIFEGDFNEK